MIFNNNNFLIVGLGVSGESAAVSLLRRGANVFLFDENKTKKAQNLVDAGCTLVSLLSLTEVLKDIYALILSPGVSKSRPIVTLAIEKKIRVLGEIELGYLINCPRIIGITGTNGKTTVTSLVGEMIAKIGDVRVVGNIGTPYTSLELDDNAVRVIELSSYQLETIKSFTPDIAAVLNIVPDHLNHYRSMRSYISAKKRIFKNMTESESLVLNADCDRTLRIKPTRKKVYFYSVEHETNGTYILNGKMRSNVDKGFEFNIEKVKMIGRHNLSNALAAVLICQLYNVDREAIISVLGEFSGVRHRLEKIRELDGNFYINDSKATNIGSTLAAVRSFDMPITLLLGGSDKGENFELLYKKLPKNIANIILFGDAKFKLLKASKSYPSFNVLMCNNLNEAVSVANGVTKGGVVLLSPSCASFDAYENFEKRGEHFEVLVNSL